MPLKILDFINVRRNEYLQKVNQARLFIQHITYYYVLKNSIFIIIQ